MSAHDTLDTPSNGELSCGHCVDVRMQRQRVSWQRFRRGDERLAVRNGRRYERNGLGRNGLGGKRDERITDE
jgi:hypothetical protein